MKKFLLFLIIVLAFCVRIYKLGDIPPSLYWDEASLGYNAYSISQSLHDEHGEFLPLTRFMGFGDYKAPGYIYAAAASIKIFGLSEFSIRFPSALAGTLLVLVTFFLAKELFPDKKVAYIAAIFVTISPWAIQFSHAAFEANLATLFSGLGILFFLRKGYIFSAICFALSMYTFNSHKIFVPMMIAALVLIFRPWNKKLLFGGILFVLLLLPLARYSITPEARLRLNEVAWVTDLDPIKTANIRVAVDDNVWWSKIIHNRRIIYFQEFLLHYSDNFKASFLFYSGDENKRLSIQSFGEMYWLDLPFLLAGLYYLAKNRKSKSVLVIVSWLLLAPIPAALARETPHALRILNILPIPQIIAALGFIQFLRLRFLILFLYLVFCFLYLKDFFFVYPAKYDMSWQYGYKQMVEYVATVENNYSCIDVTDAYGRPYIYFLLYDKISPEIYWNDRQTDRDNFGFWDVYRIGKYYFNSPALKNCLYVRGPQEVPKTTHPKKVINDLSGNPVFVIYD